MKGVVAYAERRLIEHVDELASFVGQATRINGARRVREVKAMQTRVARRRVHEHRGRAVECPLDVDHLE